MEPHRTRIPPLLPDQAPSAPPKRRRGKHPVAEGSIPGITAPPAPSALRPQAPRPASGGGVAVVPTRSEATILKQARPTARGRATMSTPSQQKACGSKKVSGDDSTHLSHAHMQSPMQQSAPACTTTVAEAVNMDNDHQLFEETPPCMTDGVGDFTDMMSDGVFIEDFSISMPYEVEEYADEDDLEVPTPVAKRTHSRSANYTTQEDTALVMAWESISLDAVKGTDQTSSTYWMRIHDHYHRNKTCGSDRSLVSLQHRWGSIQECCNKWAGCMVQVERLHPSGVPYKEHINIALELYKEKKPRKGKPFVMLHCWALLEHNQKWLTRNDEAPPKRQKSGNSSLEFDGIQDVDVGDDNERAQDEDGRGTSPTPSSGAPTRKRPPGRKAEKEKLKRGQEGGAYKEVFQEMITTRKEMEAQKETRWTEVKMLEERKTALKERKVAIEEKKLMVMSEEAMTKKLEQEQKNMFMDMSCLDDEQKAYVSVMRAQILAAQASRLGGETSGL